MIELWTEKYRPKTIDDIVLPEQEKENIKRAIREKNIPHYLFIGQPGVGKTSLANVIINELNAEALRINASEERGIDVIRDKVMRFVGVIVDRPKIVFLDEADSLTAEAQASLRNVMETYSNNCRFILTGNYDKFIAPIKDRCEVVRFKQLSRQDCYNILSRIVENENIRLNDENDLNRIIEAFYPSIRKMILTLQKYSIPVENGYELQLPETLTKDDSKDYEELYKLVKAGDFLKLRQAITDMGISDFIPVYRFFFQKLIEEEKDELGAIILTEYMFRDSFVADKELNFFGCVLSLKNRAYPFVLSPEVGSVIKSDNQSAGNVIQKSTIQKQPINNQPKSEVISGSLQKEQSPITSQPSIPKPPTKTQIPAPPKKNTLPSLPTQSTKSQQKKPKQVKTNPALNKLNSLLKSKGNVNQAIKKDNSNNNTPTDNQSGNDFLNIVDKLNNEINN